MISCPSASMCRSEYPVKFRLTSADVVHGFLLPDTNVNTMVVPGFVAEVRTRFTHEGEYAMPCHEFCGLGHHAMWAHVSVVPQERFAASEVPLRKEDLCNTVAGWRCFTTGWPLRRFLLAVLLGAWQMLMRSPLPAPLDDSAAYYASVTMHGTAMAYVVTTFFIMGFGYAVAATSLGRPLRGMTAAWIGFAICLVGTLMAVATILCGRARCSTPSIRHCWRAVGTTAVRSC